jgi:hypothetical protein
MWLWKSVSESMSYRRWSEPRTMEFILPRTIGGGRGREGEVEVVVGIEWVGAVGRVCAVVGVVFGGYWVGGRVKIRPWLVLDIFIN